MLVEPGYSFAERISELSQDEPDIFQNRIKKICLRQIFGQRYDL